MSDEAATDLMTQAVAHHQDGRFKEAIRAYHAVLQRDPDRLEAYGNLAAIHVGLGRLEDAETCWRAIIRAAPNSAAAHNNLGATLRSLGRPAEAAETLRTALRLQPVYPEASNNLGTALCELSRFEEAVPHYMDAIRARPDYPKALCNLGGALRDMRRFDDALACLSQALSLASDFPEAHVIAAQLLLVTGRLEPGWAEFEWRAFLPGSGRRNFLAPAWRGGATSDRRILIHAEEGVGDTIQFCRFVRTLTDAGRRVVLEVQPPLRRLLEQLPGLDAIIATGDALPAHDLQCPLLSLPLALGIGLDAIGADAAPYLRANPRSEAAWRSRLASLPGLHVGLAWAGNPDHPADLRRSVALARLAPLAAAGGASFISLQTGRAADQPAPPGMTLHDWTEQLHDMAETAALVAALDLVISVDTAVAHLAGALGKPIWLLNRFDTDWRWLLDREDSPWYPSMRVFRQPSPGDWETPVARMAAALAAGDGRQTAPRVVRVQPSADCGADAVWGRAATLDRLAARAMQRGDFESAVTHELEALRHRPDVSWFHNNLANALRPLGRLPEALAAYEEALRLADDARVRCNVAHVLRDLDRAGEAEAAYRDVIAEAPEFAEAHVALGGLLLETGRFEEGWHELAWRTRGASFHQRPFAEPEWDGARCPGKRVLIYSDEGLGDAIQFSRYVERAASVAEVIFESPPPLAPLFAPLPGPAAVVVHGEPLGRFDLRCALLDLPRLFGTTVDSIPAAVPYLTADPAAVAAWRNRLSGSSGLRVGLAWSGNPANPADRVRSIAPALLRPLVTETPGCSFISLQKNNDRAGVAVPGAEEQLLDWTDELRDMGDTAALIDAVDLVISVDTAVAHLAGALGKPVWLLNRSSTDWRWMRDRTDSPWYPTMRIFRQPEHGAWRPVLDRVRTELALLAEGR